MANKTAYREYDAQVLRRLQRAEMTILHDVEALCDAHGIGYFMLGGCCIGAFRHGGFIPWDDDIDLCMTRADYDRFYRAAAEDAAFSEKYHVYDPLHEKNYAQMLMKVSRKGTKNMTAEMLETGTDMGIHIDVFPFDFVPTDEALRKKQAKKAWMQSKLSYIYYLKHPHLPVGGVMGAVLGFGCRVLHALMHLFRVDPSRFARKYHEICTRYNAENTGLMTDFTYIRTEDATLRYDDVFPTLRQPFEDTTICVPREYDKIMRQYYGDYMQLPPEEKRKNHAPEILDFGEAFGDI
ncbi:MAG: phosphorylcholine transferase LicD [Acutalibacteraceae bacterium]